MSRRIPLLALAVLLLTPLAARAQVVAGTWSNEFSMPGLGQRVYAVTTWQGRLVAGGYYLRSGGRLLGSVAVFDGVQWQPLGVTPDGTVRAFAIVGGELYAGGRFTSAGGQPANHVARWDGAAWRPLGTGLLGIGVDPPNVVFAMTEHGGDLWVGGMFQAAGGSPCDNLARWNGAQWLAVPGGVQGAGSPNVRAFLSEGNLLHVVGDFSSAGGRPASHIARFDGNTWSGLGAGLSSPAFCLARYQGDLHVGGRFRFAGGALVEKIARWNGVSWSPLAGGIPDFAIANSVVTMREHDGELHVGGDFIYADGIFTRRVARWNGSAWLAADGLEGSDLATTAIAMTTWNGALIVGGEFIVAGDPPNPGVGVVSSMIVARRDGQWLPLGRGMGVDAEIRTLVRWNDQWVVGGRFLRAGNSFSPRVAAYDGAAFRTLGNFQSGEIWDAVEFQGDLVVTGEGLTTVDGLPIAGTARYDGAQWHPMSGAGGYALAVHAGELYAGGLGGVKRWNGATWSWVAQLGGIVNDLYSHGGLLWIGGNFNTGGGGPGPNLAVWNGSTVATAPGGTPNDTVDALGSYQGELVVGGTFSTIGGVAAKHVARFDGTSWRAMGGGIGGPSSFTVLSFAEVGGRLYVGGSFTVQGGAPGDNLVRWNGAQWQALSAGVDGWVTDLEVDPATGALLVVGGFLRVGAKESVHLARWYEGAGPLGAPFCTGGFEHACPCGNGAPDGAGCANSTGGGARLVASGTTSVAANNLVLTTTGLRPNGLALAIAGPDVALEPFALGNGLRCVDGALLRVGPVAQATQGTVVRTGFTARLASQVPGGLLAGRTWHLQDWYRDAAGPCGATSNLSNGLSLTFGP